MSTYLLRDKNGHPRAVAIAESQADLEDYCRRTWPGKVGSAEKLSEGSASLRESQSRLDDAFARFGGWENGRAPAAAAQGRLDRNDTRSGLPIVTVPSRGSSSARLRDSAGLRDRMADAAVEGIRDSARLHEGDARPSSGGSETVAISERTPFTFRETVAIDRGKSALASRVSQFADKKAPTPEIDATLVTQPFGYKAHVAACPHCGDSHTVPEKPASSEAKAFGTQEMPCGKGSAKLIDTRDAIESVRESQSRLAAAFGRFGMENDHAAAAAARGRVR